MNIGGFHPSQIVNREMVDMNLIGCLSCKRVAHNPVICTYCRKNFCYNCLRDAI